MSRSFTILVVLIAVLSWTAPALGHPADAYLHAITVHLSDEGVTVKWEFRPGPLLAAALWNQTDSNKDGFVSQSEANDWAQAIGSQLSIAVDGDTLPLHIEGVTFPAELRDVQLGSAYPTINLSGTWPSAMSDEAELLLINRVDEKNSINWFGVSALAPTAFRLPVQRLSRLSLSVVRNRDLQPDGSHLLAAWDSNTPVLVSPDSSGASTPPDSFSAQDVLTNLVKQEQLTLSFYLLAISTSLILGALHAMTPGHGKTIVAAYLVGNRGTTWHAVVLGSVVTLTHTGSVLLLGLVTLVASRYILPANLIPGLEALSGLLIVGLGVSLLVQRLKNWMHERAHRRGHLHMHSHGHSHEHSHDHSHEHGHSHEIPDALTWRSLVTLGISGGLVPCPDAIAILLVAVAINRILLGLALIVAFSLGLAAILIGIGIAMVHARRLLGRLSAFDRLSPVISVVSAVVVLVLGVALTLKATVSWLGDPSLLTGTVALDSARIVFLADDSQGHLQLYTATSTGGDPQSLTSASLGVTDYALSPDQTQAIYFAPTGDGGSSIWVAQVDGTLDRPIASCDEGWCRKPVWSPDGRRVVYEGINLSNESSLIGVPSLWWIDISSGDVKPVFQQLNLPVTSPRWSPDGRWLSFALSGEVRLFRLDTGESHTIPNRLGSEASWAPDSQAVFLRDGADPDDPTATRLFRYELPTQQRTLVDGDPAFEDLLVEASPRGDQIAVVRRVIDRPGENQIWLMRSDGSEPRQLTRVPGGTYVDVRWSPDARYLLAVVSMNEPTSPGTDLQVINVETREVQDIGSGSSPSWIWRSVPQTLLTP